MGCGASSSDGFGFSETFVKIPDRYQSIPEVQRALRLAGLESSNLIIGIDFTKSNTWNGAASFGGRSLHAIDDDLKNPYQSVIEIIGETLSAFDDDQLIPAFGFGDLKTQDKSVFPLAKDSRDGICHGFREVLDRYHEALKRVVLSGPTSFAPLINKAVEIVKKTRGYHILIIIADGQVTHEKETAQAIIDASAYPLSIITVGVGDGPWEAMLEFDNALPARTFDNFQFVNFTEINKQFMSRPACFALAALMELPEQYTFIKTHLWGALADKGRRSSVAGGGSGGADEKAKVKTEIDFSVDVAPSQSSIPGVDKYGYKFKQLT